MSATSRDLDQRVVKVVQELISDGGAIGITPAEIERHMGRVLQLNNKWADVVDRQWVMDELIRRFSIWIGKDTSLSSEADHEPWLSSARKSEWRYWQRYSEWLERKLSLEAIDALDRSTDKVLGFLEDPTRTGRWDRRGLVVGHVQSGKTGHYSGLICKAADAGYKIIIVLAGLHNNLRSQTQMRLDEAFLGYETRPSLDDIRLIGVGEIDGDPAIQPNYATNRMEDGDFSKAVAKNLGISPEQRPWLFVIKKNKSVLDLLIRWIRAHVADATEAGTGRKIVTQLPLLLIDDEADNASVDTAEQIVGEDGRPDPEHQPTAINSRIRKILHSFARASYVGYTATPFANIFIYERGETKDEGPDLFPSAFIVNLAAPSNYVGPRTIFGDPTPDGRDGGLPMVRIANDYATEDLRQGWMPPKHKNGHLPLFEGQEVLPPSLREAVDAFILACAVRSLRGDRSEHCSMLVHVTRFNSVQQSVYGQVSEYLRTCRQRMQRGIGSGEIAERFGRLWHSDFVPTTSAVIKAVPDCGAKPLPAWEIVWSEVCRMIGDIEVRMINGTAKDVLDYVENKQIGLKVIAIGGDKLARGLTLEGLCVSYFLRASRMYDTLMQMGRWFGYRPGFLDLCRLYTTDELCEWFGHIADASNELREEFDLMAAQGATPREYGLRVQSHPVLMVTSRMKMRAAKDLMLSFSGELLETVALHCTKSVIDGNLRAARELIAAAGSPSERNPSRRRETIEQRWQGALWRGVKAELVIDFLLSFRTHPDAYKVRSELIGEFIRSMNDAGELTNWNIALIGGGEGGPASFGDGISVNMLKRVTNSSHQDRYSIGRLLSPRDESIDISNDQWNAALSLTRSAWKPDPARAVTKDIQPPVVPSGPAIRRVRGFGAAGVPAAPDTGLLLLYALDPALSGFGFKEEPVSPIVAFGISFPGSSAGRKVLYKVNSVQWRQWELEYGATE